MFYFIWLILSIRSSFYLKIAHNLLVIFTTKPSNYYSYPCNNTVVVGLDFPQDVGFYNW